MRWLLRAWRFFHVEREREPFRHEPDEGGGSYFGLLLGLEESDDDA